MARQSEIKKKGNTASFTEIGSTGLAKYGGFVNEEKLSKLSSKKASTIYFEMSENDPTIGAFLFAMEALLTNVEWDTEAADETTASKDAAEFLKTCMDDMEHSWVEFIQEVLSMLVYGWEANEIVYKLRKGQDAASSAYRSKYDDGKVGWRKLPIRAQSTLIKWMFNDSDDVTGLEQLTSKNPSVKQIPVEKLILFRTKSRKNNPMGRSILRNAYRPWLFKKRIEEIEGVGIERDLAGLPVAHVPSNILSNNASAEERATLEVITTLVTNIRRDHQEGVVFPRVFDENSNSLYELELLSTGGSRQFDTSSIIDRYDKRIAMTVLADFLFLGQSRVGSFALSSDKTDLFGSAIGSFLNVISDALNKQAVPRLMRVNNIKAENQPKIKPGDVEKPDLQRFTDAVYKLVGVGALVPSDELSNKLSELLEVPVETGNIQIRVNDKHTSSGQTGDKGQAGEE